MQLLIYLGVLVSSVLGLGLIAIVTVFMHSKSLNIANINRKTKGYRVTSTFLWIVDVLFAFTFGCMYFALVTKPLLSTGIDLSWTLVLLLSIVFLFIWSSFTVGVVFKRDSELELRIILKETA